MERTNEYDEGYQKGLDNSYRPNPYPPNTTEHDDWDNGYSEGYGLFMDWVNRIYN